MTKKKNNPFDNEYMVYLLLGDTEKVNIWTNPAWTQFTEILQPLVDECSYEGEGDIRHLVSATYDYVPYESPLFWEEESLQKIPEMFLQHGFKPEEIEFSNHIFSFPSIQSSLPQGFTPELVINIEGTDRPGAGFNYAIYAAVKDDLLDKFGKKATNKLFIEISSSVKALAAFSMKRPWAFPIDEVAYSGAIQDENPVAIVKTLDPTNFFKNEQNWKKLKM